MFRQFFPRKDQGKSTDGTQSAGSDAARPLEPGEEQEARQTIAKYLPQPGEDDGVHRMALRSGKQKLPDDPDELAYGNAMGEPAELARQVLQAGDLRRAIYHLALALASDPGREEWLDLLDQWIVQAGEQALTLVPLYDQEYFSTLQASRHMMQINAQNHPEHRMEIVPIVGKNYHARVAVHAYILMTQGQLKDGIALLLRLIEVKPELQYVQWLPRWQSLPNFGEALDPAQIALVATRAVQKYPGTYIFSPVIHQELNQYLPLLRASYRAQIQTPTNEHFLTTGFLLSAFLRKTGAFEEAAEVARALPASYQTRVALAMAEEASGTLEVASAAYREALTFDPKDVAVRNDLSTLYLAWGKFDEALRWSEESASLDSSDPYQQAHASVAYLLYLQKNAPEQIQRLQELAEEQRSAQKWLYHLQAPYTGKLPYHGEALLNLARNIKTGRENKTVVMPADGKVTARLSSLEAPCAQLAVKRLLESWGGAFELTVSDICSMPDPRLPLRPVEYQIWRYEDFEPLPAVSEPDPLIVQHIVELAQTPYALLRWYARAHELGQRLGEVALADLLGVMVHPPATPAAWDEWDWISAVQLASALTIASLGDDTVWEGSRRKAALTSLIYGPTDWSGAAALIALAVLANQSKRVAIEFDAICCDLWKLGRGTAEWPHEQAMVFGLIFVNNYSQQARAHIQEYFAQEQQENT